MSTSLLQLLHLPEVVPITYANAPLRLVLCQIKFIRILRLESNNSSIAAFQDAIQDEYILEDFNEGIEFSINGVKKTDSGIKYWKFISLDSKWTVVITQDFITVETKDYSNFADFSKNLNFILNNFMKCIANKRINVTRIGLRYINEIRQKNFEWHEVISDKVIGLLGNSDFLDHIYVSHQEIAIIPDDSNTGVNIRHGLLPNGTTINIENDYEKNKYLQPFYLVDIDLFHEYSGKKPEVYKDINILLDQIKDDNEVIYRIFRMIVKDTYLSTLLEA